MFSGSRILRVFGLFVLLLAFAPASVSQGAESKPKVAVVAFGLFGDQSVFESEAKGAARIVADRFRGGSVTVRANTKGRGDVTVETVTATLQTAAKAMDVQNDVLFLILTSHGSRAGLAVKAGTRQETLSPPQLVRILNGTRVRHRVVIISACYSGVFLRPLADPDTLIITAADADHTSFGCKDGNTWTYFGDAFFNTALRRTANLKDAFALASSLIRKREQQSSLTPSNPQMAGGENIERILKGELNPAVATEVDPKYAFARGLAYSANGDNDRAITEYGEAVRFDPKDALAYYNRGLAYRAKGDNDSAIADYNEAIKLDPKHVEAHNARGLAYNAKRDYDRAIADYSEAIRLNAKYAVGYNNRGLAYSAKGDFNHAIAEYNEAIRLAANYAAAYTNRGYAYRRLGDYDRAIADHTEAIRLNPKYALAYNNRGFAYNNKGDFDRAIADLNEAIRLNPNYAVAYDNRGFAHNKKGDFDRAIADLNEAIRLNPKYAIAYRNRGLAYSNNGNKDHAIADLNEAIRLDPKSAEAYAVRADIYSRAGEHDKGIADCIEAIRLDPKSQTVYSNRGVCSQP